jgi:hypothetical protein
MGFPEKYRGAGIAGYNSITQNILPCQGIRCRLGVKLVSLDCLGMFSALRLTTLAMRAFALKFTINMN